jgi:hypothetical protein
MKWQYVFTLKIINIIHLHFLGNLYKKLKPNKSMQQNPHRKACSCSEHQDMLYTLRNQCSSIVTGVHWSLFWARGIQSTPSSICLVQDHFNIILPSTPNSTKMYLSCRFPKQNFACTSISSISHPSHPPVSDKLYKLQSLSLCSFLHPPVVSVLTKCGNAVSELLHVHSQKHCTYYTWEAKKEVSSIR